MNAQQYMQIQAAVNLHLDKGGTVVSGRWSITSDDCKWAPMGNCACALGCVIIGAPSNLDNRYSGTVTQALKITRQEMWAFIDGFDGHAFANSADYEPNDLGVGTAYTYGTTLRFDLKARGVL